MSEGVTIGPWAVWVCNPKGPYQYWWKIKQYSLCPHCYFTKLKNKRIVFRLQWTNIRGDKLDYVKFKSPSQDLKKDIPINP